MSQDSPRAAALGQGVVLEGVTVGYNALEGVIAIAAGLAAGSVALTGFGIDSVIEVTSGVVLWWRLRAELGSSQLGPAVEARAARWAGALLLGLALYLVIGRSGCGSGDGPADRERRARGGPAGLGRRSVEVDYAAQHDSFATSFVNACAASLIPSESVKYGWSVEVRSSIVSPNLIASA